MEKRELVNQLYDLRTALLVLGVKCDEINKKETFEKMWADKHKNKNYFDYDDEDFVLYYETNCALSFEFEDKAYRTWGEWMWDNIIDMYDLNPNYDPLVILRNLYEIKYIDPIGKGNTSDFDLQRIKIEFNNRGLLTKYSSDIQIYHRMLCAFLNNINFLNYRKKVLEDAKTNKKSPYFRELYDGKKYGLFKRIKAQKEIDAILKNVNHDISYFEKDNKKDQALMIKKYYVCKIRNSNEKKADKEVLNEVKEAIKILEKKFSLLSKSDWADIDALIFFLESGRADSIKEALNLNDLKKYKDEIVASVDRVNQTVIQGIHAIRQDLNLYFNTLFSKLDNLNNSLVMVAKEISKNTAALHYSSEQICRAIHLATY